MSFVGCIGNLVANIGLKKSMSSAFAVVDMMLLGKKFQINVIWHFVSRFFRVVL